MYKVYRSTVGRGTAGLPEGGQEAAGVVAEGAAGANPAAGGRGWPQTAMAHYWRTPKVGGTMPL